MKNVKTVLEYYKKSDKSIPQRAAMRMRLLIIAPEFLGGFVALLISIDPLGAFHVFDYLTARLLLNLRGTIVVITDVVMVVYCYDMLSLLGASQSMRRHEPTLVRYKWGLPAILIVGLGMLIADQILTYYSIMGLTADTSGVLIPTVYLIVIYATVTVSLFILGHKVSKLAKDIKLNARSNPSMMETSTTTTYRPSAMMKTARGRVTGGMKNDKIISSSRSVLNSVSPLAIATHATAIPPKLATTTTTSRNTKLLNTSPSLVGISRGNIMNKSIDRILLMRKLMLVAGWTRIFSVTGFIFAATGVMFTSPLAYALTVGCLFYLTSLVCSHAQILVAVLITPPTKLKRKRKKKKKEAKGGKSGSSSRSAAAAADSNKKATRGSRVSATT